jgi:plastocyanin
MNLKKEMSSNFVGCVAVLSMFAIFFTFDDRVATAQQSGGIIQGVVNSPWVKRYEALVYLEHVDGEFTPPAENVHMSQKNMVFSPHILPVLNGTTVDFTNDDTVAHNVFSPPGAALRFNLGLYGVGVTKTVTFDALGEVPLLCNVHPEMVAYVIVLQNPYFALTDNAGNFEIRNVPAGTYKLAIWHEKLESASKEVVIEAGKPVAVEFKKEELKKR